mgnify:CR=1 FL=1
MKEELRPSINLESSAQEEPPKVSLREYLTEKILPISRLDGEDGLIETLIKLCEKDIIHAREKDIITVNFIAHIALLRQLLEDLQSKKFTEDEIKEKYSGCFMFRYGMKKKVDELVEDWYRNNLDIDLTTD